MNFIGIDPGINGGIALIEDYETTEHKAVQKQTAYKMPETEKDILDLFIDEWRNDNTVAVIEHVHALPKQGVSSTFKFGKHYGSLLMALTACSIPYTEVSPMKWQRYMNCLTRGDKNVSKRRAQQLFPAMKITHAIADALLIAEYCRLTYIAKEKELYI